MAKGTELTRLEWPAWLARWLDEGSTALAGLEPDMKVEEFTDGDTRVVRAELPAIDPEKDVEITVDDGRLRIRAERRQEEKTEEKGRYRTEFRYGSFTRVVPLPAGASQDDVKATYRDGILEVRVPVSREAAAKRTIPVTRT
jgi:HSP20 family protein